MGSDCQVRVQTGVATTTDYRYDHTGIQTHAISSGVTQSHLIDAQNPTGYAQRTVSMLSTGTQTRRVFGDDLLSEDHGQAPYHLTYDGQGTTRGVIDASGNLAESYAFDAYGEPRDGIALTNPLTDHLYTGEPRDAATGWTYLRARYLDTSTGTFNRSDPFFGNTSDPQSLHKYAYVHGNPINSVDYTGLSEYSIGGVIQAVAIGAGIGGFTLGTAAALAGGSWYDIISSVGIGVFYGGLAGLAFAIAIVEKKVDEVFSAGIITGILAVLIEIAYHYLVSNVYGTAELDPLESLEYLIVESFVKGFALGALAEATTFAIGSGLKQLGINLLFTIVPPIIDALGAWLADSSKAPNWQQLIGRAIFLSILALITTSAMQNVLNADRKIGSKMGAVIDAGESGANQVASEGLSLFLRWANGLLAGEIRIIIGKWIEG